MRHFFITIMLLLELAVFSPAFAQNFEAMDFTVTDLKGQAHTLYDYLDDGKSVLLIFLAPWCGPFIDNHNSGIFQEVYAQRGPGTESDDIFIMYIDTDLSTDDRELEFLDVAFPVVNLTVEEYSQFELNYGQFLNHWPNSLAICPNRSLREIDIQTIPQVLSWLIVPKVDAGGEFQVTCYHPRIIASVTDADLPYIIYNWVEKISENVAGNPPFPTNDLNPEINRKGIFRLGAINTVNGCGDTDYAIVTDVNKNQPELRTDSDTLELFCFGDSIEIYTHGHYLAGIWERSWTNEGGEILTIFDSSAHHILVQGAGIYTTMTFDSLNGCSSTISIEVLEPPGIFLDSILVVNTSSESNNGSISIFPEGGTGNYNAEWNTGHLGLIIDGLSYGSYISTITDENGCKFITDSIHINFGTTANENLFLESDHLEIFPVPSSGFVSIRGKLSSRDEGCIKILNSLGVQIESRNIRGKYEISEDFNLSELPSGLYIVIINQGNRIASKPLILTQ